ncbi:hypothetical protein JAAARDRAFT_166156 [Jaapia argillacea MUCL 33604]|uniref:TRP C-terminal domain-containing protein n=1 Tax=Jaapia argillacea MUCL 33604 TaxID=933084 RepID=A0A067QND8_9AGAM|nr:hypothetical protein JAAARDRAFT_166156 [Jaapia argillacea MUCL 33604]
MRRRQMNPASLLFPLLLSLLLLWPTQIRCQPATLQFDDCFTGQQDQKLNISTIYGQVLESESMGRYLNFTILGDSPANISGYASDSNNLATLFTTTSMLTFTTWDNSSYFCQTLRPPSPLYTPDNTSFYCPIPAGPFAFTSTVPFQGSKYDLVTLDTRLRAVDPYSNEIFCADVQTTPIYSGPLGSVYGNASIIFWVTVALAAAYWLNVGIARIVSALGRGVARTGPGIWHKVESGGFILASAISGERLAKSPALMRYCTPSFRDIMFHTQWCAALSMVAVQWPAFVYPLLAQTGWSTLSYNISLTPSAHSPSAHWYPLSTDTYSPPDAFASQLSDPTSSLFVNTSTPNILFTLPRSSSPGIASFAYTIGVRPQDLWGVCMVVFFGIVAGCVVLSVVLWALDGLVGVISESMGGGSTGPGGLGASGGRLAGARSPRYSTGSKDLLDGVGVGGGIPGTGAEEEAKSHSSHFLFRAASRIPISSNKSWWKFRHSPSSFHGSVLHGNLVRILILFHLPITIFSCHQMTLGKAHGASLTSTILSAFSFIIFSLILPILLITRLTLTSTSKLYDETRTLLSFGPLYNHYRYGSQLFACLLFATNLAFGITIGCGQASGTVQAVVILVVELGSALGTSVWLPWGQGASMGLISFLFCVGRIVVAVLLVILTPTVSIGEAAGAWVAYAILFIMALIYLAFALMLMIKFIEAGIRIFGGIGFDRSRHVVDSGLLGACGLMGCFGSRRRHKSRSRHRYRASEIQRPSEFSLSAPRKQPSPTLASSGPPSVLKPEQALKPYKEDSDDESGHIMGTWQPFPRAGYNSVGSGSGTGRHSVQASASEAAPSTQSGFARVGGGRAHFDNPYAITAGSTVSFPSYERRGTGSTMGTPGTPKLDEEDSPPPTPSVAAQPHAVLSSSHLPAGAMAPSHIRTKSQTAIIEDASVLFSNSTTSFTPEPLSMDVPSTIVTDPEGQLSSSNLEREGSGEDEGIYIKKKHWYQFRKPRRYSEGNNLRAASVDETPPAPPAETGRSFVVIREKRPGTGSSSGRDYSTPTPAGPSTSDPTQPPRPFLVIRDPSPSRGSSSS